MSKTRRRGIASPYDLSLEQELLRLRIDQHALVLAASLHAVERARTEVRLSTLQPAQCDHMADALSALHVAVQRAIDDLDALGAAYRPFALLLKLRSLHRVLTEASVSLSGMRHLCEMGRLEHERSGCYWRWKQEYADMRRVCGEIVCLLRDLHTEHCLTA